MAYDIQLLVQACVYFLIFILNFVVAIPIGVNVIELKHWCMLYSDFKWVNATVFITTLSSGSTCRFPVYVAVTAIFYSLVMGVYSMYVVCRSKDPYIGFQMWVLPFIVITFAVVILMLVVSCILSVGLATMCNNFLKGKDKHAFIGTCSDIQRTTWYGNKYGLSDDGLRHFYSYPKISEGASWITFLAWTIQGCLYLVRYYRNHRCILRRFAPPRSPPAGTERPADMSDFASVRPAS